MEIADIKKQIKSGQLDKVYIFYGEEWQIIKLYLKMMASDKYTITYVESLLDIMTGAKTKSFVSERHLYVVMDDKEYLTNEQMWEKFKGLKDDIVVFYYTSADKRLKFWKQNKSQAIEFGKLKDDVLVKYIQKELPLSEENSLKLIDLCDSDYGRILLEIDKIKCYADGNPTLIRNRENNAFQTLLEQGAIYRKPYDAIFDFVAAVLERSPAKAYDLLQQSKAVGEANMVLLSVLYNNIKTLLQVQSSKNYKSLGLNGFAVKNVIQYRDRYSNGELVHAMKLLREIEKGIKVGAIPDELSIEYFLVQVI